MSTTTDKYEHIQEGGDYSHSYANAEYYSSPEFEGQLKEHYK